MVKEARELDAEFLQEFGDRLTYERMNLMAEQATAASLTAFLVLLGFGYLVWENINAPLILSAIAISVIYTLRMGQARKFLHSAAPDIDLQRWKKQFVIMSALTGLIWGVTVAMLISKNIPGMDIYLGFLVIALTAGAIPSLGILSGAYSGYVLAIMVPVSLAYLLQHSGLSFTIGALAYLYAVFLVMTVENLRQRMDTWLQRSVKNEKLTGQLIDANRYADQCLLNIKSELADRNMQTAELKFDRVMQSISLGRQPGMTYRAVNDGHWGIDYLGDGCEEIIGATPEQLSAEGKNCLSDILVRSDGPESAESIGDVDDGYSFQYEYTLVTALGTKRRVIDCGRKLYDNMGMLKAIEGIVSNAAVNSADFPTEEFETTTARTAALLDRRQFNATVEQLLNSENTRRQVHSLLYIDLDQLNIVNNTSCYAAGDQIIHHVSEILQQHFNADGVFVAHLTGDEFGILLENCDADKAMRIATEVCRYVEAFDFAYLDQKFYMTASVGVASTSSGLSSLQEILSAADRALFAAKENGRNRVHLYHPQDKRLQQRNQEMWWAIEIPKALNENRLFLEHQPIVSVGGDGSDGKWYEILIRMRDREGNVVMPNEFIPAMERFNQVIAIDTWVVKTVIGSLDHNPDLLAELGVCLINISGQSMSSTKFLEDVCAILKQSRVPANCICFEITETAAVANMEQALLMMERLQNLGCRFALDDFGSGLSSFGYLRSLPVDFLKIDGALIRDIADDRISRGIVTSITEIGKTTNKKIIAECVETELAWDILREIGVDYVQGYAVAMPTGFPHGQVVEPAQTDYAASALSQAGDSKLAAVH